MRKLFTLFISTLMSLSLWAEVPQTMNYQAVVRNNDGRLLREKTVGVRVSILKGGENGESVYMETRSVVTNVNGLLTFAIGDENAVSENELSAIDWANDSYYLRCEYDLEGGSNYTMSSISQFNSVPYALYAKNIASEALPEWARGAEKPVYNYSEIVGTPDMPTKVSEFENDANYITKEDVQQIAAPTKISQLENDADYAKKSDIPDLNGYVSTEYASLTYQVKGNYITDAEASITYQPKGDYLTEHQSLADYAKKSELPKADSLLSKAEASATYQPKGNYLTEHQSLADYAKKTDIPSIPTTVSSFTNDAGYLTEHQSLADYAKKSDLPNIDALVSKAGADTTYQPKGDYLTEHQSLADYAKKTDIPSIPTTVSSFTNDAGYLTEHQSLADYAKKSELPKADSLLSKAEATTTYQPKGDYLTEHQSLADYAKKSELPKADSLLSKTEASTTYQPKGNYLTEHQSLADYAKKSELPKADSLLSKAEASTTYQQKGDYLTEHQSLADYAKKSELPKADSLLSKAEASTTYQPKGDYLTEHQSLADYAKKSELPKADSLLSKAEASTTYQPKGDYLTEHQSLADYAKKSELPKADSLLSKAEASTTYQPKGDYLTEHQSLADYAKKRELPKADSLLSKAEASTTYATKTSVPTKVSQLTNDKGYLTEHQSLADYAKKSELPKADSLLSKKEASETYLNKNDLPTKVGTFENDAQYITKSAFDEIMKDYNALLNQYKKGLDSLKSVVARLSDNLSGDPSQSGNGILQEYKYVDLGLTSGTKWATMNVGAEKYTDYGQYIAWGHVSPNSTNDYWYHFCNTESKSPSTLKTEGIIDANGNLTAEYDAATANWGEGWSMPTKADFDELLNECTWTWTAIDGVNGYKVVSKKEGNTNWIFLPAAGSRESDYLSQLGTHGHYSSSTVREDNTYKYQLNFCSDAMSSSYSSRYPGQTIRPVAKVTYSVALFAGNGGTVSGSGKYAAGKSVTITATGADGYIFKSWSDGNTDANRNITVSEDVTLTANFTKAYTVTLTSENSNGTVSGSGKYAAGKSVTITATAADGYIFKSWSDGNTNASRTITVNEDVTLTANFAKTYTVTLTSENSNCSVSGSGKYEAGKSVTITATAADGYIFKSWSDGNTNASRTITVNEDVTLTANFIAVDAVDLGLTSGTKWASLNVGAEIFTDYGTFYAWGEVNPAPSNNYSGENCKVCGKTSSELKASGIIDANGNLTAEYDAATANWGEGWRMPTMADYNELLNECKWTWTTIDGVNGYKIESKKEGNTNWIFLPAAGYRNGTSSGSAGSLGNYWSSAVDEDGSYYAYSFYFYFYSYSSSKRMGSDYRDGGRNVRPVRK